MPFTFQRTYGLWVFRYNLALAIRGGFELVGTKQRTLGATEFAPAASGHGGAVAKFAALIINPFGSYCSCQLRGRSKTIIFLEYTHVSFLSINSMVLQWRMKQILLMTNGRRLNRS